MKKKRPTEQELLERARADELAEPLSREFLPKKDWDAWFDGERASEDFMKDRGEKR